MFHWFNGGFIDSLINWLTDWLIDWLTNWLIDCVGMYVMSVPRPSREQRSTASVDSRTTRPGNYLSIYLFIYPSIYLSPRFYIGCEKCPDWFHGRCVGILQSEAGRIEDYECPRCNPSSAVNAANLRQLRLQDLDNLRKLFKQIQVVFWVGWRANIFIFGLSDVTNSCLFFY